MMKDAEIVKSKLDNDLAEYMQSEKLWWIEILVNKKEAMFC